MVVNCSCGGLLGYSSSNYICNLKVPPSHIVSKGPRIRASHMYRLSSSGTASIPSFLLFFIFFRSCRSLLWAVVDIYYKYAVYVVRFRQRFEPPGKDDFLGTTFSVPLSLQQTCGRSCQPNSDCCTIHDIKSTDLRDRIFQRLLTSI